MAGSVVNTKMNKYRDDLNKMLHEPNTVNNYLAKLEEKTNIPRLYVVLGFVAICALYLIFGYFAELACNFVGFVYPAYMSFKAIESPSKDDDTQWLTYWVVFAVFNVIEFASDVIVGWFPFYWLVKCALMLYLHLPMTKGAEKLYNAYIRPWALKHQAKVDSVLGKAKMVGETLEAEAKKHMN
uniref:Receptor expression-enhancing protein n=1 Tax=Romanomermis culicivorax TaxID=13658 RepID=A0A915KRH8_ROMCU